MALASGESVRPAVELAADILRRFVLTLPKADLHVHLEGAVRPVTMRSLADRYGVWVQESTWERLLRAHPCRNYADFEQLMGVSADLLREPADFARVARELAVDSVSVNVRYLEVTVSVGLHHRASGIPVDEIVGAMTEAAAVMRRDPGVEMTFILDHPRGYPIADMELVAECCVRWSKRGVVALGLSGYEPACPVSAYADAIRWARTNGVPFVPHAGEASGPGSIWDALEFSPPRIGHGIRAAEDPVLLDYLRASGVTLDVCPSSNLRLSGVSSLERHPLHTLWNSGVTVTIGTDDPVLLGTNLVEEYLLIAGGLGFTVADIEAMNTNAFNSALGVRSERTNELGLLARSSDLENPGSVRKRVVHY